MTLRPQMSAPEIGPNEKNLPHYQTKICTLFATMRPEMGKKEMLLLSITGSPAHLFKAALHDFFLCDNTSIYQVSTTRCGHIHACEHFVLTESFEFKS